MQLSEQNQIAINEQLAFLSDLRTAIGAGVFLDALLVTSKKAWDECSNMETDEHLIKGIAVSPIKTDACNTYVAKLIKQYLAGQGTRCTAWTKNTISSENFTNKSIASIIAATTFMDHREMFKIVVTRLMGFDDTLVEFAMATHPEKRATKLMLYLAGRFDLVEGLTVKESDDKKYIESINAALQARYNYAIEYLKEGMEKGKFTETWFIQKAQSTIEHFSNEPEPGDMYLYDHFDLLTQE